MILLRKIFGRAKFNIRGSADYWERRYRKGRNSGEGSYGPQADFKAEVINRITIEDDIQYVVEFGCGDGNQLKKFQIPKYLGLDVSRTSIQNCIEEFKDDGSKSFICSHPLGFRDNAGFIRSDMALSLDVIYHLVEDAVFISYMDALFGQAEKIVTIFSTNTEEDYSETAAHVRRRNFVDYVAEKFSNWQLKERVSNPHGPADFWIYQRRS